MLQTVCKAGKVLDLFTSTQSDWGVAEAATALGMPKSSAHAMLTSLVDTGLLRTYGRGRYRVGWRVVELGESLRDFRELRRLGNSTMDVLADTFGETCHIAVWDRGEALFLDRVLGHHPASVAGMRAGSRVAPHTCASGKVLLACGVHDTDAYLRSPLRKLTLATTTDATELRTQLAGVRMRGWAVDACEAIANVHSIAAPISGEGGDTIAALSITVSSARFLPRRVQFEKAIRQMASDLSSVLTRTLQSANTLT